MDEFGVLGIDSADDGDDDYSDDGGIFKSWNKQKKFADEEEFDLEYDEDVDAEAEDMRRKMAGIWGYRDGGKATGGRVISGDEMEDWSWRVWGKSIASLKVMLMFFRS